MFPLILQVKEYDKNFNICYAETNMGQGVAFDPFVSCAIELSDDDFDDGKGGDIVGNKYVVTDFCVRPSFVFNRAAYIVTPIEGGLTLVNETER